MNIEILNLLGKVHFSTLKLHTYFRDFIINYSIYFINFTVTLLNSESVSS